MAIYVNTDERVTHEDVAKYLQRCGQTRMAGAVRQWESEGRDLGRRYHELLMEATRLRQQIKPAAPAAERVSYKSQWD